MKHQISVKEIIQRLKTSLNIIFAQKILAIILPNHAQNAQKYILEFTKCYAQKPKYLAQKPAQNAQNAQKSGILICSFWCGFGGAESHIISIYKGLAFSAWFKWHRLHGLVSAASVLFLLYIW